MTAKTVFHSGDRVVIVRQDSAARGCEGTVTEATRPSLLDPGPQSVRVQFRWPRSGAARPYRFAAADLRHA